MTLLYKCLSCGKTWHDSEVCPHCGSTGRRLMQRLYCFLGNHANP